MKCGERVYCKSYLRRIHDGVFIAEQIVNGEKKFLLHPVPLTAINPKFSPCVNNGEDEYMPEAYSPCEGAYDLEKTYYQRKAKWFSGVVVEIKDVVTEAYLGVEMCDYYNGDSVPRIFKSPKTIVKCAKVYYALGKSRLVPLADLERVEK